MRSTRGEASFLRKSFLGFVVVTFVLAAWGCSGVSPSSSGGPSTPILISITVTAPLSSVAAGNTDQFTATGHYSDGSTQDLTSGVTWDSSNKAVATISNTPGTQGLASAVAIGSTNITASLNGVTSSPVFSLTVTAAVLTSITVTSPLSSVAAGNTDQFTATGHYSDGSTQDLTSAATWNSSNTAAATISNIVGTQGLATGVATGSTNITASLNGVTSSADTLTVTPGSGFGFIPTSGLTTGRWAHTATLLNNGMVLIAGGNGSGSGSPSGALTSAELYNPTTGTFTPTGSLTTGRWFHTATLLNNGMVLIAGGVDSNRIALASAELYDPATGTFTLTGSMPRVRRGHTATLLNNGEVLIAGGEESIDDIWRNAELYDPTTGIFTSTGSLNTARSYHTATLLNNGMVLIAGGDYRSYLASAELYDPTTGIFTSTGSLNTARDYHTATLLNNGMVLVAGGNNGGYLASAELYDPTTGSFASTGSLNTARDYHTATLLNNEMVLLAGGNNGSYLASAELYDPTTGSFTSTGSLNTARDYHTATLLNNGMVLIAAGLSDSGPLATAELYGSATPAVLVSIAVSPLAPTIRVGDYQRFVATGTFGDGSTEQLASVTWSSSNTTVATITNDAGNRGAAYAVAAGSAIVSACAGSVCGSTTLTVGAPALTSIAVTAPLSSITVGSTDQFTATGHYSNGSTQDLTNTVTWNSSNTAAATISNTAGTQGLATGVATGSTNITASFNGVTSSPVFSLTVNLLTSLAVTAPLSSVALGNTDQFTATGHYSDGSTQDLTSGVTWNSSNAAAATISNTAGTQGLATAVAIGSTNITASLNGVTSSAFTLTTTPGFVPTGSMTDGRDLHTATLLNDGMVLIAEGDGPGIGSPSSGTSAELYDPAAGTFTPTGSMRATENGHRATLLNNGMVLITGVFSDGDPSVAQLYNPATGTSTPTGSMPTPGEFHTATLLNNGKVLIAGGILGNGIVLASAELYDPATRTFTPTGSMTTPRAWHTATLLNNGMVLIAGGPLITGGSLINNSAELYDPATGTFTHTGNTTIGRIYHTATLLNNGMVLLAGGVDSNVNALASAELYDPTTGSFTSTGSLNTVRALSTSTLLNNGTVLIAGGVGFNGYLPGAELYDPATGTFTLTGSMHSGRYLHTATLLNNGEVLIAGGLGFNGYLASAELYEPGTLTPAGLVSIAVSPLNPTISSGTSQRFIATGTFSDGSTTQLASVTWSSSNTAIAAITNDASNEGAAFGAALGTSTINACTGSVCGSTTLTVSGTSVVGMAASTIAVGGGGQSATVLTAFATPLQAIVEDALGNLVPNVAVTFTAPASGPSGTFANGTATTTAVTNSSGVATASAFTANSTASAFTAFSNISVPYSVTASVPGALITASFGLANTSGAPASITATAGSGQSASTSTAFATRLQVIVKDASGNLVQSAIVTFTAPPSGASGTFGGTTTTTMVTTNSSGVAAQLVVANSTLGSYIVTASVPGVSTTASFNLTNILAADASIIAAAGGGQTAMISTAFATPLQATVKDAAGYSVANATVTFTAPASGASGTFANGTATTTAVTDSSGVATASAFTANSTLGAYSVTASVSGVSATASFSLANTLGVGASIIAAAGGGQSATISTTFATALQAKVLDGSGNSVPNMTVTFTAPGSGPSGTFANGTATTTAVTNSSGVATASAFTANSISGAYSVTASVSGISATTSFSLTNTPGGPDSIVAADGGEQSAAVSTTFATPLRAAVLDASRNLLPNVTVTFTAPASGASGTFANGTASTTVVTNSGGVATASAFSANGTPGVYSVTVSATGVSTTDSFRLTNNPGLAPGATGLVVTETSGSQPVLGGGTIVLVDGIWAGNTDSSGSLTTPVTPGSHDVTILDLAGARGDVSVVAVAGASTPVTVDVSDSDNIYAPGSSTIPQIIGGVFAYADQTKNPITIQFFDVASNPVIVSQFSSAYLRDNGDDSVDLSPFTTVTVNGTLSVDLVSALQTLGPDAPTIAAKGPFLIEYSVKDANGVPHGGAPQFNLGIYSIAGTVQAPPSNPALPVGNVQLSFQSDSGAVLQATSDAGGAFTISGVPPGSYTVQGSVTSIGITYNVRGTSVVQGNVLVSIVPLGPWDIWNNVASVTTTPATGASLAPAISNKVVSATATLIPGIRLAPAARSASRPAQLRAAAGSNSSIQFATVPSTSPYGPSITTPPTNNQVCTVPNCAPGFGEAIAGISYTIPIGTPSVTVIYQVCIQENLVSPIDVASVAVRDGNGNQLFGDGASVYAQSTSGSVFQFQANGCTAVFQHSIDISALTSGSPTTITVYVAAQDAITDEVSLVPTFVTAILAPSKFTIQSFTLDDFNLNPCPQTESGFISNIQVCLSASRGDPSRMGNYVSIPSPSAIDCLEAGVFYGNCFHRPATAVLDFPQDKPLTVTNVELDLVDLNGNTLDTIFNEAPGNSAVLSSDAKTLSLSSIGYLASSQPNSGMPSNLLTTSLPSQVSYVLTVTSTQGNDTVTSSKKLSLVLPSSFVLDVFRTLWSARYAGIPEMRYGARDLGGDDWATQDTINWLKENPDLITRFDDISGEHGRNIGHLEHGQGTDVDIFQFVNVCNCDSGTANYRAVQNATVKGWQNQFYGAAFNPGDKSSLNTLSNYVKQNRMRIDNLNGNPNISLVIFGTGSPYTFLPLGWLEQAMKFGTLTLTNGQSVDLGVGAWTPFNNKMPNFNEEHNSHVHIRLVFH